ncbi:MAG: hypothetical protein ABSG01_14240 [Anaerolineales bacterium]|jgi:hypothetical protein
MAPNNPLPIKRQSLAEIIRRLEAGEIQMSELSNETLQAIAGPDMEKYTDEQLAEIVRTGKLPDTVSVKPS